MSKKQLAKVLDELRKASTCLDGPAKELKGGDGYLVQVAKGKVDESINELGAMLEQEVLKDE